MSLIKSDKSIYESMQHYFPVVEHNYQPIGKKELNLVSMISNSTFTDKRIVGFNRLLDYRRKYDEDAIVLVSNHLSEADFLEMSLFFYTKELRLLIQGGDNLFREDVRIKSHYATTAINLDKYLRARGAFQVLRQPKDVYVEGRKKSLKGSTVMKLNKAYLFKLVEDAEMFLQFPGQSGESSQLKHGRPYDGRTVGFNRAMFQMLIDASEFEDKNVHLVPVNMSYESVLEDTLFSELEKLKTKIDSEQLYQYDMDHIIGEYMDPARQSRFCLKFGMPSYLDTGSFWDRKGILKKSLSEKLAEESYQKVMSMQTAFPSHIFFTAVGGDWYVEIPDLKERITRILTEIEETHADMHYLRDKSGETKTPDAIIDETISKFRSNGRKVIAEKNGAIEIRKKDVAKQYANHIAHFFMQEPEEKQEDGMDIPTESQE